MIDARESKLLNDKRNELFEARGGWLVLLLVSIIGIMISASIWLKNWEIAALPFTFGLTVTALWSARRRSVAVTEIREIDIRLEADV